MSISISGNGSFTGANSDYSFDQSVGIAGTLTYEDVTNIDSVGVITARSGIKVGPSAGIGITLNADGSGTFAGNIISGIPDPANPTGKGVRIRYTPSGSNADFGQVLAQCADAPPAPELVPAFWAKSGTADIFRVYYDGSATFAGTIENGSFNTSDAEGKGSKLVIGSTSASLNIQHPYTANNTANAFAFYKAPSVGATPEALVSIKGDGSATFAGDVTCGSGGAAGVNDAGVILHSATGGIFSYITDSTRPILTGYLGTVIKAQIAANGNAKFAGIGTFGQQISNSDDTVNGMRLHKNGYIELQRSSSTPSGSALLYGYHGDTGTSANNTVQINVNGDATFAGALSKGSGSFKIDHPIAGMSTSHHLVHSFIEGPQADLIYSGMVTLVAGRAEINLDTAARMTEGTFLLLNTNLRRFVSNEGGWTAVKSTITGNILTVEAQDNTCTDEVFWTVIGERHDQHMIDTEWTDENGRVITEPLKS